MAAALQLTVSCLLAQEPHTRRLLTVSEGTADSPTGGRPSIPLVYGSCQPNRLVSAIAGAGAGALAGWLTYSLLTLGGGSNDADGRRARRNVVITFAVVGSVGAVVFPPQHSDCVSSGTPGSLRDHNREGFGNIALRVSAACKADGRVDKRCFQWGSMMIYAPQTVGLDDSLPATAACNVASAGIPPGRTRLGGEFGFLRPFGAGEAPRTAPTPRIENGIQSTGDLVHAAELTATLSGRRFLGAAHRFAAEGKEQQVSPCLQSLDRRFRPRAHRETPLGGKLW